MDKDGLRRNAILASLPGNGLAQLASEADVVSAEVRLQVYQPGSTIDTVYFPLASVFSLVGVTDERAVVEVATVGREGMVGLPVFLGAVTTPHAAFCQVGGPAVKLSADGLRRALAGEANGALHDALNRFTQATIVQIAQNVVCNSTHPAIQRAARWLLTTRDRLGSTDFPLTQEFLSQMLGLRRPTVSHTARQLQEAGLIRYTRGNLTITDPRGLEKAACSCYAIVRAEFDLITGAG